ncbi:alternative oxidase [Candidatus Nitrospira neomarina]|uniref:Alternative oxidase n=1 Tax=Candidatus Nitrospira neomarina TaxID=3020899 RepID=A0AA96GLE4_9BACT|nr:alternative oxidase [Candidatus Nitrospira neomarina]WNM64131.1 alternative oxidase [Candidatus Nitrospira neomarina]
MTSHPGSPKTIDFIITMLSHEQLHKEQQNSLASPPIRYGMLAKILFLTMDIVYGRKRTWNKFKILELIARVPYQAWEHVAYIAITHSYHQADFARRIYERIQESRHQQDNEQWHLLILEEWIHRRGIREGFLRHRLIPQVIAFVYYHISWLLYVINPSLSYRLNMEFEDHAEREYMRFVQEHPEFDREPFMSCFKQEFGNFDTMGDVLRQIGFDERMHKEDSLKKIEQARFT